MTFDQEAVEYTRNHVGGMQPVETVGDKVRAAYIAGALAATEKAAQIAGRHGPIGPTIAARIREQGKEQDRD